jgi:hypothetical protein
LRPVRLASVFSKTSNHDSRSFGTPREEPGLPGRRHLALVGVLAGPDPHPALRDRFGRDRDRARGGRQAADAATVDGDVGAAEAALALREQLPDRRVEDADVVASRAQDHASGCR